ncbi:MAG: hypothetical protein GY953_07610 [bacterium]|nr:hypothetical protein [bacterium]
MDPFRYYLALTLLVLAPPALLTWLIIHPLAPRLRRFGPVWAYVIVSVPNLALAVALFRIRVGLLSVEFGTRPLLIAAAALFGAVAIAVALQVRKQLALGVLMGLPEILSSRYPGKLLTEGIYARIRHPRLRVAVRM